MIGLPVVGDYETGPPVGIKIPCQDAEAGSPFRVQAYGRSHVFELSISQVAKELRDGSFVVLGPAVVFLARFY